MAPAMSRKLKTLKQAGLVEEMRQFARPFRPRAQNLDGPARGGIGQGAEHRIQPLGGHPIPPGVWW